jgi:hypothetical protein
LQLAAKIEMSELLKRSVGSAVKAKRRSSLLIPKPTLPNVTSPTRASNSAAGLRRKISIDQTSIQMVNPLHQPPKQKEETSPPVQQNHVVLAALALLSTAIFAQRPWLAALVVTFGALMLVDFRSKQEKALEAEYMYKQKAKARAEITRLLALAEELRGTGRATAKKSMPKAQQIFDALVDDVEGDVLDRFSLNRTDDSDHAFSLICSKAKELLQRRLQVEMEDALEEANGSILEALSKLGEKIAKSNYLGKEAVDAETMGAVQEKYKEIGMSRRESLEKLLQILLPQLPLWLFGACFAAYVETWTAFTLLTIGTAFDELDHAEDGMLRLERGLTNNMLTVILMLSLKFAAGMLLNRVHNLFRGKLKAAVMVAILRQDTVYFDQHPPGLIQQQLHDDTSALVSAGEWVASAVIDPDPYNY